MSKQFTETTGDLFTAGLPAIGHGCNCTGLMGAGIAAGFRERWPDMYAQYRLQCRRDMFTLGSYMPWVAEGGLVIFNLATQELPGPHAKLSAIYESVCAALLDCEEAMISQLGVPRIGTGIGGLDWSDVRTLLRAAAETTATELVAVSLPGA